MRCKISNYQNLEADLPAGMPGEGFEPPTFGLQNRCTTTVLTRQAIVFATFYSNAPELS